VLSNYYVFKHLLAIRTEVKRKKRETDLFLSGYAF